MKNDKSTFLKGALILASANMLVKLIGAAFKIPLTWLIGDDGMGLFTSAFTIYALLFTIATSGFPLAISKMVSESLARGKEEESRRIFVISLFVLGILGAICSFALYFGAAQIAGIIKNTRATRGIMAIAPAVFFVAISCAFRGYFQGKRNMLPTALSNIMEALGKLVVGYFVAFFMLRWGIEFAAAGAIYGVAFGTAAAALLLLVMFLFEKHNSSRLNKPTGFVIARSTYTIYRPISGLEESVIARSKATRQSRKPSYRRLLGYSQLAVHRLPRSDKSSLAMTGAGRSIKSLAKELFLIALPITFGACIQSITTVVDTFTITPRLQTIPNITSEIANTFFGAYTTKAVTIMGLPLALIVALSTTIVPTIASALASGEKEKAKRTLHQAIRITSIFAMPCAIGIFALSSPILYTIYGSAVPDYAPGLLRAISLAIFCSAMVSVTSAILQAYGKMYLPVIYMISGGILKLIFNWFFLPIWGIAAAPVATNICYGTIVVLNLTTLAIVARIRYDVFGVIVKPLIACLVMWLTAFVTYPPLASILGIRIATLASIALSGIAYLAMLFATKAIKKGDLKLS